MSTRTTTELEEEGVSLLEDMKEKREGVSLLEEMQDEMKKEKADEDEKIRQKIVHRKRKNMDTRPLTKEELKAAEKLKEQRKEYIDKHQKKLEPVQVNAKSMTGRRTGQAQASELDNIIDRALSPKQKADMSALVDGNKVVKRRKTGNVVTLNDVYAKEGKGRFAARLEEERQLETVREEARQEARKGPFHKRFNVPLGRAMKIAGVGMVTAGVGMAGMAVSRAAQNPVATAIALGNVVWQLVPSMPHLDPTIGTSMLP